MESLGSMAGPVRAVGPRVQGGVVCGMAIGGGAVEDRRAGQAVQGPRAGWGAPGGAPEH